MSTVTRIFRAIKFPLRRRPATNAINGAPTALKPGEVAYGEAENALYVGKSNGTVGLIGGGGGINGIGLTTIHRLTQAEYDLLEVADPTTLYVITD
jgi:hypothetical protein